jgi:multidrug efflux pump subunit AcrB
MDSLMALNSIPVNASTPGRGDVQLLANLATVRRTVGPPVISHYNIVPVIDVYGGVSGRDLGGVLTDIKPIIHEVESQLPRGSFIMMRGQAETMRSSFTGLAVGLLMAMILIYLLLVVNFQNWLDPFIIITALPAALAGVAWSLHVTLTTLSELGTGGHFRAVSPGARHGSAERRVGCRREPVASSAHDRGSHGDRHVADGALFWRRR